MEARIRLDNDTDQPAIVDRSALELLALDLASFPPPILAPEGGLDVAPEQSGTVTARFAYPPGESAGTEGLRAVDLRWSIEEGGRHFSNGLTFHRVGAPPNLSDPWFWEPEPRLVLRGEIVRRSR